MADDKIPAPPPPIKRLRVDLPWGPEYESWPIDTFNEQAHLDMKASEMCRAIDWRSFDETHNSIDQVLKAVEDFYLDFADARCIGIARRTYLGVTGSPMWRMHLCAADRDKLFDSERYTNPSQESRYRTS